MISEQITDAARLESGRKLLAAAHEFWRACRNEGQPGAIQYLEDTDGALIVFTRGEYRNRLLANIQTVANANALHRFGENIPLDTEPEIKV